MRIVSRLLAHHRPPAQPAQELAAELARLHDLHRAGILSAAEERAMRSQVLADAAAHRTAA